jgi:hypothetical protein
VDLAPVLPLLRRAALPRPCPEDRYCHAGYPCPPPLSPPTTHCSSWGGPCPGAGGDSPLASFLL